MAREYEAIIQRDPERFGKYTTAGISPSMLANRLSWFYDLRGPSLTLDTACSSGLNGLHLACQDLSSGSTSMVSSELSIAQLLTPLEYRRSFQSDSQPRHSLYTLVESKVSLG